MQKDNFEHISMNYQWIDKPYFWSLTRIVSIVLAVIVILMSAYFILTALFITFNKPSEDSFVALLIVCVAFSILLLIVYLLNKGYKPDRKKYEIMLKEYNRNLKFLEYAKANIKTFTVSEIGRPYEVIQYIEGIQNNAISQERAKQLAEFEIFKAAYVLGADAIIDYKVSHNSNSKTYSTGGISASRTNGMAGILTGGLFKSGNNIKVNDTSQVHTITTFDLHLAGTAVKFVEGNTEINQATISEKDFVKELNELKTLLEEDIISQDEFEQRKQVLKDKVQN